MLSAPWKSYCSNYLGELSSLSFDPYTDLLWTASPTGTIVSHFLPSDTSNSGVEQHQERRIARYSSFKSHNYRSNASKLLVAERGVLSLADNTLKFTNRRGIPYWYLSTAFQDACSMAFTAPKSTELLIGGAKPELVLLNASTGALIRTIDISNSAAAHSPITHLTRSQSLICCGARSGTVTLRDPVSLKEEHSMMAHYAGLEQMETEGNYLVTCGYSLKQGHPVRDPLVKVFDVRALRPLPPITFSSSPAHVRFHPRMSSTLFITSSTGQLQIIDLAQPIPTSSFYQLDVGSYITDMCISSSGDGLAYAEADGLVHLWTTAVGDLDLTDDGVRSTNTKPIKWSRGNMPIVLPDSIDEPAPIQWTDETPLSSIGMPYYSTELFSVLPLETYITPYSPLYQRRPLPDTDLTSQRNSHHHHQSSDTTHEVFDGGGQAKFEAQYIPNPKKTKRYQANLPSHPIISSASGRSATARVGSSPSINNNLMIINPHSKRKLSIPLFRSEKEKEKAKILGRAQKSQHHHMETSSSTTTSVIGNESERDDEISFDMSLDDLNEMPKWYRQVEIKYSKFGIEDFDFGFYNNTQYSGLETHIVNSYTNSLLQILYHTIPVRKVAESHISLSCLRTNCMLCELGFLFKMMDDASGVNCQTSNFSRSFSINQKAIALELMDHQHQEFCLNQTQINHQSTNNHQQKIPISSKSYSSLIQLCHHFLLDQIAEDDASIKSATVDSQSESLRFQPLLNQTSSSSSTNNQQSLSSFIGDIYTTRWKTVQSCPTCHHQISRSSSTKVIELIYPRKALSNEPKPLLDFCSILKNSLSRETIAKSLCSNCNSFTHQRWRRYLDLDPLLQTTTPTSEDKDDKKSNNKNYNNLLPTVLAINAGVTNSDQFEIWLDRKPKSKPNHPNPTSLSTPTNNKTKENKKRNHDPIGEDDPHFLQAEIGISIQPPPPSSTDRKDSGSNEYPKILIGDNHPIKVPKNSVIYQLRSIIVQIQDDDENPHLVSLIKVGGGHCNGEADDSSWFLFNDFLVKKISQDEALSFPACWKVPCVLYYVRKDFNQILDLNKLNLTNLRVDKSILLKEINLSKCRDLNKIRHEVLKEEELPKKGDLVAIDAEFVSLQQEEVDYKSDGTKLVRRPSQMTLARVSVLRGEGSKTGVPFIDDHIQTFEPIADYLTEFSGIRPGDLDLNASPHTLVPLKVAYKKLRLLVDLGCIFIGHGLSKDFRIINIHVPPSQIIDTVDLYYIASRQRKLSLRLLSYLILRHDIQNAGTHDSIEDARTALQLYDIYRQLNNEGVWKDELENVYRKGKEMGWKVPADKSRSPLPAPAIPPAPSSTPSTTTTTTTATTTTKPPSTKLSTLSARNSTAQVPRFTPSTLSAASATYFPPTPPNPRPAQPLARQSLTATSSNLVEHAEPAASFYRSIPQNSQAKASPPATHFGHNNNNNNNLIGGPNIYNNNDNNHGSNPTSRTATTTTVFQRFTTAPPPVFEPKKKPPGFNPMAPSFVHSSSSSTSSATSSTNRSMMPTSSTSTGFNTHNGTHDNKKTHSPLGGLPNYHHHHPHQQQAQQQQYQHHHSHSSLGSTSLPGSSIDLHSPSSSLEFFQNNNNNNNIGHTARPNNSNNPNEMYNYHHHQQHPHPHPTSPHVYPNPPPPPHHNIHHHHHHNQQHQNNEFGYLHHHHQPHLHSPHHSHHHPPPPHMFHPTHQDQAHFPGNPATPTTPTPPTPTSHIINHSVAITSPNTRSTTSTSSNSASNIGPGQGIEFNYIP
ncbi:hypothetical protein Pst134EA_021369 [Puccinia striiformis f. sp. tritici]|uniref:hypothetical protein n=1 Tax=Puccinia striiformis f. sp. tritici TaxID=168172 RepID=UPI0020072224|nr:hypothetical protein Pst134EA_021369 [Puccinia striiformis f. sp. tritici]KAH9457495.1 hypothetical protein Pst134EA_021369 [Puccinia striiformis f. sp. tritici]